jgi:hypothetical protein
MTEPTVLKIEIDDEDVRKLAEEGQDATQADIDAKAAEGAGLDEVAKESGLVTDQLGSMGGMLGNVLKIAAPVTILAGAFSKMAQFSGPFISALQELDVLMIDLGIILGEVLGPVLISLVSIVKSLLPVFNLLLVPLKLAANVLGVLAKFVPSIVEGFKQVLVFIARGFDALFKQIGVDLGTEKFIKELFGEDRRGGALAILAGGAPAGFAGPTADFIPPEERRRREEQRKPEGVEVGKIVAKEIEREERERKKRGLKLDTPSQFTGIESSLSSIANSNERVSSQMKEWNRTVRAFRKDNKDRLRFAVKIITKGD